MIYQKIVEKEKNEGDIRIAEIIEMLFQDAQKWYSDASPSPTTNTSLTRDLVLE